MRIEALSRPPLQEVPQEAINTVMQRKKLGRKTRLAVGLGLFTSATFTPLEMVDWASNHPGETAQLLRQTVGDETTLKLEGYKFAFDDWKTQQLFKVELGPNVHPYDNIPSQIVTNPQPTAQPSYEIPFDPTLPEVLKPKPFILPPTHLLVPNPIDGEGSWSIAGLPTTADDLLMARTFIRIDNSRPYANVTALVIDSRRIQLHMVGGAETADMGGGKGPGRVPDADIPSLLAVFNGGFQFSHADWGMYMDGIEYKPLKPGYATVAVFKDGSIKMGTWGQGDLTTRTDNMVAVRQNAMLLVDNGEVTNEVKNTEANVELWGKITSTSSSFITYRSAIGLDKDGNLIIANGSALSALDLARGLWAAGAVVAMQLDINQVWTETGIATHYSDGEFRLAPLRDGIAAGYNFVDPKNPQGRDIMYVTFDPNSSRYAPRRRKNRGFRERQCERRHSRTRDKIPA